MCVSKDGNGSVWDGVASQGPWANYNCGVQQLRPEWERALPEHVRNEIDAARGGYDLFGNKLTKEEAAAIVNMWAPRG
jgi:hypothetical protein